MIKTERGAKFSECKKYRYALWRIWNPDGKIAMCIGLNPSTANETDNDPTIRNLISLMANNGFGGFYMMNLFALISPNPEDLRSCPDPVCNNDFYLMDIGKQAQAIIYCWGNFKQSHYRQRVVKSIFEYAAPKCFGKNANGSPKHPLYLKQTTQLINF